MFAVMTLMLSYVFAGYLNLPDKTAELLALLDGMGAEV